ncbi:LOW QUALITY PROTEIN: acetylcholinesterase-like [Galendromus occidentalis]|uniref:Carboxylic ester hydrolase n=1 Tax=Galendromus occidentalis TaxID=34638 RepID=A0AAJ7L4D3_9ACAR|nr:LOW QUALITY PROTEIN: acetylcholinesterase-like [Galendromus occidentalis]
MWLGVSGGASGLAKCKLALCRSMATILRSMSTRTLFAFLINTWLVVTLCVGRVDARAAHLLHHHRHRTAGNAQSQGDPLVVHTTKGPVRGITLQASNGKLVDAFLGIPYAKPPVGKMRFRHPVPMDPWEKPLNVTEPPATCVQVVDTYFDDFEGSTMWNANTNMSEDCLNMLVWVPRPRPTNAAVLLWVYGGSFYSGCATLDVYDGKILASEENVIVVSFNYRVGSLGFLYLDHADAPGNAGMMDQVMALRWVQDNIHLFGGNPNNVTLFGESAGAVSVAYHLLSPLSRDLFSQAVLQSGGATVPWGYNERQTAITNGYKLAEEVKCPTDDVEATIKCLRLQDPDLLVKSEIFATGVVDFSFIPVVDGAFLTERPEDSMSSGNFKKCKILLGSNRDEGTYFIIYYLTQLFKRDENVYLTREDFVDAVQALSPFTSSVVNEAIIFEYTDWLNPDDPIKNRDAVDKIVGDYYFTCPVIDMAHYYSSAGLDVYMYYYVYRSSQNKWPEWMGVIHADEIAYVFGEPLNQTWSYRQDEQMFSRRIMRYWANFARMGNPSLNPDGNWEKTYWPAHTAFGKEFLILDVNSTQVGYGNRAKHCAFWKNFLPNLIALSGNNTNKADESCKDGASTQSSSSLTLLCSLAASMIVTGRLLSSSTARAA